MTIKFDPRNICVGLYGNKSFYDESQFGHPGYWIDWHLCIVPCFPIIWTTYSKRQKGKSQ